MPEPGPADEPPLSDVQKAYNVAQSDLFQLAAWGHCKYHPAGELLTNEGKRQHAQYRDAIHKAQAQFEAAVLIKAADEILRVAHDEDGPGVLWNWWDAAEIPGSIAEFLRGLAQQIREEQG